MRNSPHFQCSNLGFLNSHKKNQFQVDLLCWFKLELILFKDFIFQLSLF